MAYESSDVVKFKLGSLLQGQMKISKIKNAYNLFVILPRLRSSSLLIFIQ